MDMIQLMKNAIYWLQEAWEEQEASRMRREMVAARETSRRQRPS